MVRPVGLATTATSVSARDSAGGASGADEQAVSAARATSSTTNPRGRSDMPAARVHAAHRVHTGLPVGWVAGEERNLKLTLPEDLDTAERLLAGGGKRWRTGLGFDVHAFAPGRPLVLCGVPIAHELGLLGHSDADVAFHAVTDAVLGAIAAGDIGAHFPPSDPRWRDADSALFLRHAAALLAERGGRVENVDLVIVCERPKIGPHRAAMAARTAEVLGLAPGQVSVKATTSEGLGFTGRGEGIAAQAVVSVGLEG